MKGRRTNECKGAVSDSLEYLIDKGLVLRQPSLLVSYYARNENAFVHLGKLGKIGSGVHAEVFEAVVLGVLSYAMHLKIKPAVGTATSASQSTTMLN